MINFNADEHTRTKFKKPASDLPDKDTTEYSTPVEFLEGLSKLVYHFKSKGKLFISQELLSGKRKEPYKEPEIKDYGTAQVDQQDEDVEIRSSVKYTLDDNQKLRLRREHLSGSFVVICECKIIFCLLTHFYEALRIFFSIVTKFVVI